ncbi:NAD(P)H-hydrate dehydratase [Paracoccus chinensis]|uniref:Bifunctional NAD(P)H-hydrate repair enzyme n=1 Tax=Paracoccus chinensis TaxID=525640 RepID=A0A1G9DLP9_9RHOB|nr:NAD(P)H-hydrate dehydratase [Paracoccus chinensis]SDK64827.1 yjeF C-terminal region, hydroxyethylthiazole kinase-related/yjeF N-terminal region [Paracoccus chinensis]
MGWTEVLTTAEMRALETAAMASGAVMGLELMERAGTAVAGAIRLRWPKAGRVTVLCGPGNNGGDGYVVARQLAQAGWRVRVLGMDNTPGPDAAAMKRRWAEMGGIEPLTAAALGSDLSDLVVDAIFGTGMTRPLDREMALVSRWMGGWTPARAVTPPPIVAVDAVSGLCLDSGAWLGGERGDPGGNLPRAALTVTFHAPKVGHLLELGPVLGGELVVADIGLKTTSFRDAEGQIWSERTLAVMDPPRHLQQDRGQPLLGKRAGSHKFDHGHALIVAGTAGQGGAARLSARAALRVGAGLVTLAPPADAMAEHSGPPDALMRRAVDDAAALSRLLGDDRLRAVCLGPGCGTERAAALLEPLLASRRPAVLDADALTALAGHPAIFEGLHGGCVLTPHMGEFRRLFPDLAARLDTPRPRSPAQESAQTVALQTWRQALADMRGPLYSRLDAAREAAARSGAVVLLKGPDTVIAAPDGQARIHSAFDVPWLATAGAGDVLAGIIAGLLARGLPPLEAVATGAFLHAAAARRFGPGLIADDLPEQLPGVFRDLGL